MSVFRTKKRSYVNSELRFGGMQRPTDRPAPIARIEDVMNSQALERLRSPFTTTSSSSSSSSQSRSLSSVANDSMTSTQMVATTSGSMVPTGVTQLNYNMGLQQQVASYVPSQSTTNTIMSGAMMRTSLQDPHTNTSIETIISGEDHDRDILGDDRPRKKRKNHKRIGVQLGEEGSGDGYGRELGIDTDSGREAGSGSGINVDVSRTGNLSSVLETRVGNSSVDGREIVTAMAQTVPETVVSTTLYMA